MKEVIKNLTKKTETLQTKLGDILLNKTYADHGASNSWEKPKITKNNKILVLHHTAAGTESSLKILLGIGKEVSSTFVVPTFKEDIEERMEELVKEEEDIKKRIEEEAREGNGGPVNKDKKTEAEFMLSNIEKERVFLEKESSFHEKGSDLFKASGGDVYLLVSPENIAYHAGVSAWDKVTNVTRLDKPEGQRTYNINHCSLSVEIVNLDSSLFPLGKRQQEVIDALCIYFTEKYQISLTDVVSHADIAPKRKRDTGKLRNWRGFSEHGGCLFPTDEQVKEMENQVDVNDINDVEKFVSGMREIGYTYGDFNDKSDSNNTYMHQDVTNFDKVNAFKMHFVPSEYIPEEKRVFCVKENPYAENLTKKTWATMLAVKKLFADTRKVEKQMKD